MPISGAFYGVDLGGKRVELGWMSDHSSQWGLACNYACSRMATKDPNPFQELPSSIILGGGGGA